MTAKPVRLQLSRRKGFDLQAHSRATNGLAAVNCARPGPWGNPFVVGEDGTRADCVRFHIQLLGGFICLTCKATIEEQEGYRFFLGQNLRWLRGKNLACWCSGSPCHVDVLLELANADTSPRSAESESSVPCAPAESSVNPPDPRNPQPSRA